MRAYAVDICMVCVVCVWCEGKFVCLYLYLFVFCVALTYPFDVDVTGAHVRAHARSALFHASNRAVAINHITQYTNGQNNELFLI